MIAIPSGKLGDPIIQYLEKPDWDAMHRVDDALSGLDRHGGAVIRALLEMCVHARAQSETNATRGDELFQLLATAVQTKIVNIAQAGEQNATQTGSGTQTVSDDNGEFEKDKTDGGGSEPGRAAIPE